MHNPWTCTKGGDCWREVGARRRGAKGKNWDTYNSNKIYFKKSFQKQQIVQGIPDYKMVRTSYKLG